MVSLADYFAANRYKAKYSLGDRVFGYWNKIPFIGSVGNDTEVSEAFGPQLSIHLDLPIKYKSVVYNVIIAKHTDIKKLSKLIDIVEQKEKHDKITNRKTRS
jgi:hypothetical protein